MEQMKQIIQMLEKINENTSSSGEFRIAVVTAIAAIAGTVIGAFVTYFTTRIQVKSQITISTNELRANTISKERLDWLGRIRDAAVDLIADFENIYGLLKRPTTQQSDIDPLFDTTTRKTNAIVLMLNPDKNNQKQVIEGIYDYQAFLLQCVAKLNQRNREFDDNRFKSIKENVIHGLWSVGKETWGKIKELK